MLGWVGMVALAGLMFKALGYGGGVDLWNVSKVQHVRFTKVRNPWDGATDVKLMAR